MRLDKYYDPKKHCNIRIPRDRHNRLLQWSKDTQTPLGDLVGVLVDDIKHVYVDNQGNLIFLRKEV